MVSIKTQDDVSEIPSTRPNPEETKLLPTSPGELGDRRGGDGRCLGAKMCYATAMSD